MEQDPVDPGGPERQSPTAAVVEVVSALGLAIIATLLLVWPLTPQLRRAEFPLIDQAGEQHADQAELARALEEAGLAERIEIVQQDGRPRLRLDGYPTQEGLADSLEQELSASGYRAGTGEFGVVPDTSALASNLPLITAQLALQATIFLAAGAVLIRRRVRAEGQPRSDLAPTLLVGAAGGAAALILAAAIGLILEQVGLPVVEQVFITELLQQPGNTLALAPWFVLLLPLSEEVFFRGYAFRFLTQRAGLTTGFVVSSVLFAVVHFNMSGFLIYLTLGCLCALVQLRTGRVLAPVVAHVVFNGVGLSLNGLGGP